MTSDVCHLNHVEGDSEDRRLHAARHRSWEKATAALGYHPLGHCERERAKLDGHRLVPEGGTFTEQLRGAEQVLRAWLDRSLSSAIGGGYWRKHPDFSAYVAMIDVPYALSPEVWAELRRRYGRHPGPIPSGYSCWYPRRPDNLYRRAR